MAQNSSFAPDFADAQTAAYRILTLIDTEPEIDSFSDKGLKPVGAVESAFKTYNTQMYKQSEM